MAAGGVVSGAHPRADRSEGETTVPPIPRQRGSVEVWSHLVIDMGVEILLDPRRSGLTPEQVRALARGVMELFDRLRSERE